MKLDTLAFGVHPDDVEACCGGLLLNLKNEGCQTGIIDLTPGQYSTNGTVKERQKEAEKGRAVLGCQTRENLNFDERDLSEYNLKQEKVIIQKLRDHQPDMVLLPYWEDRHPDHVFGSKLLQRAVYNSGLRKIDPGPEPHRPKWILFYAMHYDFAPDIIVDVSEVYEQKVKAISRHQSQFKQKGRNNHKSYINNGDFLKFWEARSRTYGYKIGVQYGEPYKMINPPGIDNPFNLKVKDF